MQPSHENLFARHGESQANILHEVSNRGLKHPLTQKGREQASLLAKKLQNQSIARIYSQRRSEGLVCLEWNANQVGS